MSGERGPGAVEAVERWRRRWTPWAAARSAWLVVGAAVAVCAWLLWFQARQVQRTEQTLVIIRELRDARVDLIKGFLHLVQSGEPGAPFSREQGLAMLRQAVDKLQHAAERLDGELTERMPARLGELEAELRLPPAAAMRGPGRAAAMRSALHGLEREADRIESALKRRLDEMRRGNRREFAGVAGTSAGVIALLGGGLLWTQARARRAAEAIWRSEARFAAVVEQLGEGLVLFDENIELMHWNRAALEMHEFASIEEVRRRLHTFKDSHQLATPEGEILPMDQWPISRIARGERLRDVETIVRRLDRPWERIFLYGGGKVRGVDGREHGFLTIVDVTKRRRAEAALRMAGQRQRKLARRLMEIQETERRQLARELHDEIGQALTAIKLSLQTLPGRTDGTDVIHADELGEGAATRSSAAHRGRPAEPLARAIGIVDRALAQTRSLSLSLRPPLLDDLGLVPALRWLADRQRQASGRDIVLAADELVARPSPLVETACFRIAQEAVTNALRHGDARRVEIALRAEAGGLLLCVGDDGGGFDVAAARARAASGESLGLAGMEERAELAGGAVEWRSAPGAGAEVRAHFPLSPAERPEETVRG